MITTTVLEYKRNDHFFPSFYVFTHVFWLKMVKNAFKRTEKSKAERFCKFLSGVKECVIHALDFEFKRKT